MPDVINVGTNAQDVQRSSVLMPYSKVIVLVDDNVSYEAGNDSGKILEVQIPWGTQEVANNLLESMKGVQYQPYTVTKGVMNPAAELGDAVSTNAVYGGLYQQNITFGHTMYSDYSAPQDEQLDNEYKYESSIERKITRQGAWTKTEFKVVEDSISTEVSERQEDSAEFRTGIQQNARAISLETSARQSDSSEFRTSLSLQSAEIEAKVSQTGGSSSSFGWSLIPSAFTLYAGSKAVFTCNSTGITVDGKVTARTGFIGNGSTGFTIGNTSISNGMTSLTDTTNNGIYLGTNGIALGRGNFKVEANGTATVKGTVYARSGYIGNDTQGFSIGNTNIKNGMTSLSDTTNEGVYLGVDGIALGKGTFKVTKAGKLTCTNAEITGTLTANTGKLGSSGFTIGTKSIYNGMTSLSDTTNNGVYVGTDGIALGRGNFKVTNSGELIAKTGRFEGTVYLSKLAFTDASGNAVTISGDKITDGTIGGLKITNGAISDGKIATGAVSSTKLSDGAVGEAKLSDGAVSATKVQNKAVTKAKTSSGVQTSLDNGDSAAASIASLTSGTISANYLGAKTISGNTISATQKISCSSYAQQSSFAYVSLGDSTANGKVTIKGHEVSYKSVTISGTTYHLLGY